MQRLWWRRFPGRLKHELGELRRAGIQYVVNKPAFQNGILEIELEVEHLGCTYRLVARYPETFPDFRVEVTAPGLTLKRHQNPFTQALCLLGRRTENWHSEDTLAWLIHTQFPKVLEAQTSDRSASVLLEEDQGEPLTTFYRYLKDSGILVDGGWEIPTNYSRGWLKLGFRELRSQHVDGAVLSICDDDRSPIVKMEGNIVEVDTKRLIWVRWIRHDDFVTTNNEHHFFQQITSNDPQAQAFKWHNSQGIAVDITGVLMREEVRRGELADAWVFVLREGSPSSKRNGLPRPDPQRTKLVRAQRSGWSDIKARIPETAFLKAKTVSIVGLGCIGSTVAVEMAKAGCGKLVLIDHDLIEPGQAVRWPVGFQISGQNKAKALADFIRRNWPYAETVPKEYKIGTSRKSDADIVKSADLVMDCSAEEGVQRYLARLCRENSKPLVMSSTTQGARGGIVVRLRPGLQEACFRCLELYQKDEAIPNPPEDSAGRVQPAGCAEPTFTGASFDAMEISLMAIRTAAGELGRGENGSYPDCWWSVAVLSLRTAEGRQMPPSWDIRFLRPHELCREQHH